MKKTILFTLLLSFWLPAVAQHEVAIGYGFRPVTSNSYYFGTYASYDLDNIGAFYGAYTYNFNKHFGIGGTYCFEPRMMNCWYYSTQKYLIADLDESCHSIMGHVKLNTANRKHLNYYTKFDAGVCFWNYKLIEYHPELFQVMLPKKHCCFAWNIAVGMEAGNDRIAGFAQVGIGMEGVVNLGIRYKFNNKAK